MARGTCLAMLTDFLPRIQLHQARQRLAQAGESASDGVRTILKWGCGLPAPSRSLDFNFAVLWRVAKALGNKVKSREISGSQVLLQFGILMGILMGILIWVAHDSRTELTHVLRKHLDRLFDPNAANKGTSYKSTIRAALELAFALTKHETTASRKCEDLELAASRSRSESIAGAQIHHFQATA